MCFYRLWTKQALVGTFNETRAPTSRKYVAEQGIVMPNWSKIFQNFWSHSSVFALEKQPQSLLFRVLLPLRDPLVATFNEMHAPTSRKYVAEEGIVITNWSNTFQTFWSRSSIFALEKRLKNLNFQNVFTSKRPFGGYFQWDACIYFQKICSWTMYSDAKLIKNISIFLVALLRFCFKKTSTTF